ncbi:hypothetical protein LCGC14_3117450 [marine sediment metagenome]|uniref:Uncharacterized protein n=1 Tax=marine sediment metagenome TaxID=412755 RepID=A0A0F8YT55_9ZZZZ
MVEYVPSPESALGRRKGPHPPVHLEGECDYCASDAPVVVHTPLARWEQTVQERLEVARICGPPNWLVNERRRKGEERKDTAERLRREYGLDVPTIIVPTKDLSLQDVPTPCEDCGLRPREGRYKVCSGCRKKAQRGR